MALQESRMPEDPAEALDPLEPGRYWHSCLLGFHDVTLERKYRDHVLGRAVLTDRFSCLLQLAPGVMFAVIALKTAISTPEDLIRAHCHAWPSGLLYLGVFFYSSWLRSAAREVLTGWRPWAVAGIRICTMIVPIVTLSILDHDLIIQSALSCWYKSIVNTGILAAVLPAFGYPLIFQHHFWLQTLIVFIQMRVTSGRFCDQVMQSDAVLASEKQKWGTDLCHGDLPGTYNFPSPFSAVAQLAVLPAWLTKAACLLLPVPGSLPLSLSSPLSQCQSSLLFLQLALGWWVPTALLYVQERRSRAHFLLFVEENHNEDLTMVEYDWDLEHSREVGHRLYRIVSGLVALVQCLVLMVMMWYFIVWLLI